MCWNPCNKYGIGKIGDTIIVTLTTAAYYEGLIANILDFEKYDES